MVLPKALLIDVKYFEEGLHQYLESNNLSELKLERVLLQENKLIYKYLDTETIYNLTGKKYSFIH